MIPLTNNKFASSRIYVHVIVSLARNLNSVFTWFTISDAEKVLECKCSESIVVLTCVYASPRRIM